MHFNNLYDLSRLALITAMTLYGMGVIELCVDYITSRGRTYRVMSVLWVPATLFGLLGLIFLLMAIPA